MLDLRERQDQFWRLRLNIPPLSSGLDQERWDRLLKWLDADTNRAGEKYEWIRTRLIKIFVSRGSSTSDELADVTIDRVATRLVEIQDGYVGERLSYFYGVAKNVYRESLRKDKVRSEERRVGKECRSGWLT